MYHQLPAIILEDLAESDEEEEEVDSLESCPVSLRPNLSPVPSQASFGGDFAHGQFDDRFMSTMVKIARLSKGRSRFGKVYKFLHKTTMKEYTVAKMKLDCFETWSTQEREKKLREFCGELEFFHSLKHDRIARFYGYFMDTERIFLMRTFVPQGSVEDRVTSSGPLSEATVSRFTRQAAEALFFLHNLQPPVIHKNLQASNLLITLSDEIRLADLGVSTDLGMDLFEEEEEEEDAPASHYRRSLLHAAPELLPFMDDPNAYTDKTDTWALGCVVVFMLTGACPHEKDFTLLNDHELYKALVDLNCSTDRRLTYDGKILVPSSSEKMRQLIERQLQFECDERCTASELLDLPALAVPSPRDSSPSLSSQIAFRKFSPSLSETTAIVQDALPNGSPVSRPKETAESRVLLDEKEEKREEKEQRPSEILPYLRWIGSRILIFSGLMLKWMCMVFMAAGSLFLLAFSVLFSIYLIYNGIGVVCQCQLNEGFIVLIALILLPILILLTTLCCNNSCEKYRQAVEDGTVDSSRFVYPQPDDDVVLCGIIVVDGAKRVSKHSIRRKMNTPSEDPTAAENLPRGKFVRGVARLA